MARSAAVACFETHVIIELGLRLVLGLGLGLVLRLGQCIPAVRLPTVGRRAFSVAGARVWNALPADVISAPSQFPKTIKIASLLTLLFWPRPLNFSHCVVLAVAVCYLGHPKNLLID